MASVTITDHLLLLDLRDDDRVQLALMANRPLYERLKAAINEIQRQRANVPAKE